MAGVKALSIRGIRSFGPDDDDQQFIKFSKPLTLILGQNGCGKTTIIECLRYAVTGQQPPGSRNECFVYDAKVNKTREIMGQAKLMVENAAGRELTVTRSMQVTSKEKRTQFKTLDASVERKDERGLPQEISSRCADIDHILQQELGVSKAIINSVIFCHQEDSSWPLDEGKKVKERFDEIFDADKYSDCFDKLKKIRKDYGVQIKLLDQKVQYMTEQKEGLDKKKIEVVNTEKSIEEAELKIATLANELKPIRERIKAIETIQKNLIEFESTKNKITNRLEHCQSKKEELKKAIKTIFEGSDDELKRSIDSYETEAKQKQSELKELQRRSERLAADERKATKEMSANEVKFNRLALLEGQHQDRLAQRSSTIAEAAKLADVSVAEDLDTSEEAARAMSLLTQKSRDRQTELRELTARADAEEKMSQRLVDDCRDALARHNQKIVSKKSEIEKAKSEIARLERAIADADQSRAKLESLEAQLQQVEREYESKVKELDSEKCQSEINEQERILERLDAETEQLNATITKLQKKSTKLAEKKALEESLASKEKALGVLKNKHRGSLMELLHRIPERGFALAVSEVECSMRADVDSITKQLKEKQHQVTKLESERAHVRELLKEARAELTGAEDKLYQACGALSYDAALTKLDATVDKLRDEHNALQSSVFIINKYKDQLKDTSSCPLCNRGFDSDSEVVQLMSELTTKVINVPATLERVSEQLSRQAARRDELVQLKSVRDKVTALRDTTVPQLDRRLGTLDQQLNEATEGVEELSMSLAEPERRLQTAKQLTGDMPLLDRYTLEIQTAQKDLKVLTEQCGDAAGEPTLEEATARQKELRQKMSLLRTNVKTKQSALNAHTKSVQTITNSKHQIKQQLLDIQKKVQEVVALRDSVNQLVSDRERCAVELVTLEDETPRLKTELDDKESKRNALVAKNRNALESLRQSITKLDNVLDKIRALEREIHRHEEKNVSGEMSNLKEANKTLQDKKAQILADSEELAKKIDAFKDEFSKQEIYKRDLEDNAKLRAAIVEAEKCEQEIAEVNERVGGLDQSALQEKEPLLKKQTNMFREQANTEGSMKTLKQQLADAKRELNLPKNRNLERDYRAAFYELHTMRALDKDIRDYSAAMDKCLMQFHKEKMESINHIIREMWRNIYRGNDIDYIEIKTGGADTTGATDRRKYEYRVVQSKNGVEIDMRGRCSAGQKVLACLIIRLALAETFSTRFGVLALDEPTTNLDQDNIKSLCRALGEIVRERQSQRNFMFILITHDREFIESLGNIDKVTHYYEVSRNEDGKSRIKKHKFS